jgi:3-oxoacyl-[acyl-carrier-protein] synthase II
VEAAAIHAMLPGVPVTAPRSYFGNLGAAAGAMEMAASVLAFSTGLVPPTLNYERPDPACPVRVVSAEPASSMMVLVASGVATGEPETKPGEKFEVALDELELA